MTTKRTAAIGPLARCGYNMTDAGFTSMPLDGPLIQWGRTVHIGYLTGEPGRLDVELGTGKPVLVPVSQCLNQVYGSVVGRGATLLARSHTAAMVACVGGAVVGLVDDPGPQP
jgi:hypothetical protein